jgi:hypothetical protein
LVKATENTWNSNDVRPFTGEPNGLRRQQEPDVNKEYTPITAFLLFMEVIQLLVTETNKYYTQYLGTLEYDVRCSCLPDITVQEIRILLTRIIQMGHEVKSTMKSYCSNEEQFFTKFYTNTMKHDRYIHILRFLHFCDLTNQPDKNDNINNIDYEK